MNNSTRFSLTLALGLFAGAGAFAADHDHRCHGSTASTPTVAAPTGDQAAWLAAAKAAYPLDTCVVSGEKLGGAMGSPIDHIHKVAGKPDRLVRFCCKDCVADFNRDPAKYLAVIDAAAAAKKPKGHAGPSLIH